MNKKELETKIFNSLSKSLIQFFASFPQSLRDKYKDKDPAFLSLPMLAQSMSDIEELNDNAYLPEEALIIGKKHSGNFFFVRNDNNSSDVFHFDGQQKEKLVLRDSTSKGTDWQHIDLEKSAVATYKGIDELTKAVLNAPDLKREAPAKIAAPKKPATRRTSAVVAQAECLSVEKPERSKLR